ncbi:flagellar filament capping protein FliD [Enterobacteriaceae bacterium 4M9]|nr:flagellar filament capping protein FliD [Enterobacteriaceae bacterium 4M9]
MATISGLGVGSGLDTASLLTQMAAAEQTRLTPYTNRQNSFQAKISAWGQITDAMNTLKTSTKALSGDAFNTQKVSSNDAFTATTSAGALSGTHKVVVNQLASAHSLASEGQKDADERLGTQGDGTRTMVIEQANGEEMRIELKDDETSLNQIAKKINAEEGDVTASVVRSDDGYQLILTSKKTGEEGEMTVRVEGDDQLNGVVNSSNMTEIGQAQDAKLQVNGISYTRSSNNVTDILPNVTLTLNKVSTDQENGEQLTLTPDTAATKTGIQDFVKNYNALLSATSSASKWVQNDSSGLMDGEVATQNSQNGALMGDSMLRGMVGEFRGLANGTYGESDAEIRALADIGIKIDASTGQMTLDEAKLDKALADNPEQVQKMFVGTSDNPGLAVQMTEVITKYAGDEDQKVDGLIKEAKDGLDEQLKLVKTQIDKTQVLIDAQVERYRRQFQNLDSVMTQLSGTSNSLTAMLMQYS